MPILIETELKAKIKSGNVTGLYLIYGSENYLKFHYVEQLRKQAVAPDFEAFNFHSFEGKETSLDEIHEAAEAVPLMSPSSCVLVKDFPLESLDDIQTGKFTELVSDVSPSCALIFLRTAEEPPPKKKGWNSIYALCKQYGAVVELNQKGAADLRRVVTAGVKKRGCALEPAVADYFIACVGTDLNLLLNETDKLCAYAPNRTITRTDIDRIITKSLEANAFDITKALLSGRPDKALSLLDILLAQKAEPLMLLGAVNSSFIDMYRVRVATAAGKTADYIAELFAYRSAYRLRYAAKDAAGIPLERLRACLELLHKADERLKSSSSAKRLVLEQTFVELSLTCRRPS